MFTSAFSGRNEYANEVGDKNMHKKGFSLNMYVMIIKNGKNCKTWNLIRDQIEKKKKKLTTATALKKKKKKKKEEIRSVSFFSFFVIFVLIFCSPWQIFGIWSICRECSFMMPVFGKTFAMCKS